MKDMNELLEFSILNINKPSGPTSFNVSDFVRKKLKDSGIEMRKTSHFGTLDPKVTGVLPIALNRACKLTGYFIGHDKEYVGIARFHKEISKKKVEEIIKKKFLGVIKQTPPVKSRVKRQEREREIKSFEILEVDDKTPQGCTPKIKDFTRGKDFLFQVVCQGGTYIRKLLDDLGKELGVGAHMLELRRIRAGIFSEPSVNLYDFEKAVEENKLKDILIPAGEALKKIYPVVEVKESVVKKLWEGKAIFEKDILDIYWTPQGCIQRRDENLSEAPKIKDFNGGKKPELKKNDKIIVFAKERFIGVYNVLLEENKWAKSEFVMQPIKN